MDNVIQPVLMAEIDFEYHRKRSLTEKFDIFQLPELIGAKNLY